MVGFKLRQVLHFVACFLVVASTQAQTPQSQKPSDSSADTIKLSADVVVVDAQVIDRKSHEFIRGLKPQDFDLFEDEALQRIEFFSQDKLPLSIVLLVDISPSVRPVIEKIREGALQALQHLRPEDEIALMAFAGWTELIQDFTRERQLIQDKLGTALDRHGSGTRIHEAVGKAARQMRYATNPASRRVIIAITDNQGSMDRYRDPVSEEEVRQTVMESGATVCGIIVRSLLNVADAIIFQHPQIQAVRKRTSVNPYVEQTGGELASASKDEVNVRLGEMLDHLRTRYSLGYSPTNQNYDGKFRKIRLGLSAEARKRFGSDVAVNARQGYYAADRESEELLANDTPETKQPDPLTQPAGSPVTSAPAAAAETPSTSSASHTVTAPEPRRAEPAATSPMLLLEPDPEPPPNPYSHLVLLDVHAINKKTGAAADNLAKTDFELDDNGARSEIVHFSRGEMPLSLILLIDVGGKTPYVMSSLRRNIAQWVRRLGPDDEIALMGFGGSAAVVQEFTRNRKLIAAGIRDFADVARQKGVGYGQDRTTAVFQAAEYMEKAANPISRRVIITITDDSPRSLTVAESGSTARLLLDSQCVVYAMVTKGLRPSRKREVAAAAAQGAIYSLGNPVSIAIQVLTKLGTEALMDAILKDRSFGQMIQKTGGIAMKIDGEDANEQFASLLGRIKSRYVLGIAQPPERLSVAPSATVTQSGFHTVKLKLTPEGARRHGDLSVATVQGYYARVPEHNTDPSAAAVAGKQDQKSPH